MPLNAISCGVGGDRVQNILCQYDYLPSYPYLRDAVVMCGTNSFQHNTIGESNYCSCLRCPHPCNNNWSVKRDYKKKSITIIVTNKK